MRTNLYAKPVRKSKERLFYVCKIGNSKISIIISTDEAQYWRVRDKLQEMVDVGCFDGTFSRGNVFCERVARVSKDDLTDTKKSQIITKIKNNFRAISFEELSKVVKTKQTTLEHFMPDYTEEQYYDDVEEIRKILPLQEISRKDYFFRAVSSRFPEFAKKLQKEHKMLADTMEVE